MHFRKHLKEHFTKNYERSEMLFYFKNNKLVYVNILDVTRIHETPQSEGRAKVPLVSQAA